MLTPRQSQRVLPSRQNELLGTSTFMGVGETGHDSAFVNPPYCKKPLYGGLGNKRSEVIAMNISSMSMTWMHITSSSTCSN